jgi:hypothetical protein
MKRSRYARVALGLGFAAALCPALSSAQSQTIRSERPPQLLVTPSPSPNAVHLQQISGKRISPFAFARFSKAGLDPTSADFISQVHRRLSAPIRHPAPVVRDQFSVLKTRASSLQSSITVSSASSHSLTATNGSGPPVHTGATGTQSIAARSSAATIGSIAGFTAFTWSGLYTAQAGVAGTPISTLSVPGLSVAVLTSANDSIPEAVRGADLEYSVPDCGIDVHSAGDFYRWDQSGPSIGSMIKMTPPKGSYLVFFNTLNAPWPILPLGSHSHSGTLTVRAKNVTSSPRQVTYAPASFDQPLGPVTVDTDAPFIEPNALGITADNSTFSQASVERINTGDADMSGDDYIGQRVQTAPGYSLTASILASRSVSDINDTSPDNAYRGASIKAQPQGNRLETVVHWHVSPGESLQYVLGWDALGPVGQRPLLSMPTSGPCDS